MTERSDAFRRFQSSTMIDYGKWRDGEPYDVAAIDEMSAEEKAIIAEELSAKNTLDWRDVAALKRIGTPDALKRIKHAGLRQTDGGGAAAMEIDVEAGWDADTERRFIAKLEAARLMESAIDRLFGIAVAHPTPAVLAAVYRLATEGEEDMRYAHGALLLHLSGHADEWYGLDDTNRPHLLGLKGTPDEQAAARAWLKAKVDAPKRPAAS